MNPYETKTLHERLCGNDYAGRGIVLGKSANGAYAVSAYFIMGRSENSRNRVFTQKNGSLYTEPFDNSKVSDPSLIIYRALCTYENKLIVTNGDQTDTIYDGLKSGKSFEESLESRRFEPDAPNLTPRISGMIDFSDSENGFSYKMSILKSIDEVGSDCARYTYSYPAVCGLGHFIHTYRHGGDPLPTFCGEPERVVIPDDIDAFADEIWTSLDGENKISLYVRYTELSTSAVSEILINKNR